MSHDKDHNSDLYNWWILTRQPFQTDNPPLFSTCLKLSNGTLHIKLAPSPWTMSPISEANITLYNYDIKYYQTIGWWTIFSISMTEWVMIIMTSSHWSAFTVYSRQIFQNSLAEWAAKNHLHALERTACTQVRGMKGTKYLINHLAISMFSIQKDGQMQPGEWGSGRVKANLKHVDEPFSKRFINRPLKRPSKFDDHAKHLPCVWPFSHKIRSDDWSFLIFTKSTQRDPRARCNRLKWCTNPCNVGPIHAM